MAQSLQTQPQSQTPINTYIPVKNSSANEKPKIKLRFLMAPPPTPILTQPSTKKHSSSTSDENNERASIPEAEEPSPVYDKVDKTVLKSYKDVKKKERERSKKLMLSIALTREELEADIFALTGGKRMKRRWKKKGREVQRDTKHLFPGHSLCSKNIDYFRRRYGLDGK